MSSSRAWCDIIDDLDANVSHVDFTTVMTSEAIADADHVNSDDSIELENTNSDRSNNNNNTNTKMKARRVPVKGIKQMVSGNKKKRASATQRDYLISNLNRSKSKQRQRTVVAPPPVSKHTKDGNEVSYYLKRVIAGFVVLVGLLLFRLTYKYNNNRIVGRL